MKNVNPFAKGSKTVRSAGNIVRGPSLIRPTRNVRASAFGCGTPLCRKCSRRGWPLKPNTESPKTPSTLGERGSGRKTVKKTRSRGVTKDRNKPRVFKSKTICAILLIALFTTRCGTEGAHDAAFLTAPITIPRPNPIASNRVETTRDNTSAKLKGQSESAVRVDVVIRKPGNHTSSQGGSTASAKITKRLVIPEEAKLDDAPTDPCAVTLYLLARASEIAANIHPPF